MNKPTRVICDRCGGAGVAGQGEFASLGNLLEFTVVPRKFKRKDGWTPVLQREFIARLAMTGSPSLAVEAMGKCLHGVRKLLNDPGSDSFRAAWERAVEIGEGVEARRRISEQAGIQQRNVNMGGGSRRGWQPPDPESEAEGMDEDAKIGMLTLLMGKFGGLIGQERTCRLQGAVVEADFHLRQATVLEVAFDLMAQGAGLDQWQALNAARRGGHGVIDIADTFLSRLLDDARRAQWAETGEPERPETTPERFLTDHGDHRTLNHQYRGKASTAPPGVEQAAWEAMDEDEQTRLIKEHYAAEAAAQIAWEAKAAAEAAEWRAREEAKGKKRKPK